MRSLLFISNGYGEDTIASGIVRCLRRQRPDLPVLALPLVGQGHAYRQADVTLLGPQQLLPSGGLIHAGMHHLVSDLQSGLVRLTWQQIRTLRQVRRQVQQVIAVGDVFPVILGGLFCRRPLMFVGTARSDWFVSYSTVETWLFRWLCRHTWARDEPTAATLRRQGVSATWVGNAMMDCMEGTQAVLDLPSGRQPIAMLPGSRQATFTDFPVLLEAAARLGSSFCFVVALATSISLEELRGITVEAGWTWVDANQGAVVGRLEREGTLVLLTRDALGAVLQRCSLVLGQAGTANEQAAGLGRPLVAFDSDGRDEPGWYRARQKGLLGDALRLVARDPAEIAAAHQIMQDPILYAHMQQVGVARMGPAGASETMAREILETIE